MPSPSESEYSPSFGSVGNESTLSFLPSPSVSALFGLVPIWYSCALVRPSLSESALPSPPLVGLRPLATSHPSGRPSPSLSALFMFVPSACSSALVRPSPSQSAPPSLGSRGSDPSPLTAEAADRARRKAKSMLIVFVFVFVFIFLHFQFCFVVFTQRTRCSLFPNQRYPTWYSQSRERCKAYALLLLKGGGCERLRTLADAHSLGRYTSKLFCQFG